MNHIDPRISSDWLCGNQLGEAILSVSVDSAPRVNFMTLTAGAGILIIQRSDIYGTLERIEAS